MSKHAEGYVWERSRAKGSNLLMLLKIADLAQDDGRDAFVGVKALAGWCRLSLRAARYILHKLETDGELLIDVNTEQRSVTIGRRTFVPEWFLHVRCVCDWAVYEHESKKEKFASSNFRKGRRPRRAQTAKIAHSGPPVIGKDFPATGSPLPSKRKNDVSLNRKDPLSDPLGEYKQGPVGPAPPERAGAPPRLTSRPDETGDTPDDNLGVITKLAHFAIEQLGPTHEDLTETVKSLCGQYHIKPYDSAVVRKAIESAIWQRGHRERQG